MSTDLLAAPPRPLVQRRADGEPLHLAGSLPTGLRKHTAETPVDGPRAVQHWIALLDRAEALMAGPDPTDPGDPNPQRTASKALDSLVLYEHQLAPSARRQAREQVWLRDHPGRCLPTTAAHAPNVRPDEPLCLCLLCREEWEQCRCNACRLARREAQARMRTTTHSSSPAQ